MGKTPPRRQQKILPLLQGNLIRKKVLASFRGFSPPEKKKKISFFSKKNKTTKKKNGRGKMKGGGKGKKREKNPRTPKGTPTFLGDFLGRPRFPPSKIPLFPPGFPPFFVRGEYKLNLGSIFCKRFKLQNKKIRVFFFLFPPL